MRPPTGHLLDELSSRALVVTRRDPFTICLQTSGADRKWLVIFGVVVVEKPP